MGSIPGPFLATRQKVTVCRDQVENRMPYFLQTQFSKDGLAENGGQECEEKSDPSGNPRRLGEQDDGEHGDHAVAKGCIAVDCRTIAWPVVEDERDDGENESWHVESTGPGC